jgi:hypothetical protein
MAPATRALRSARMEIVRQLVLYGVQLERCIDRTRALRHQSHYYKSSSRLMR